MKYKVGDQVKIKSRKEIENLIKITDSMLKKCGTVMKEDFENNFEVWQH